MVLFSHAANMTACWATFLYLQDIRSSLETSIYPSIIYTDYPLQGRGGASQLALGERRDTPSPIGGPTCSYILKFTLGNSESPINLSCMFLDCGRKPEYLRKTHAGTRRTCKLHSGGPQSPGGFEPRTLLL